MKSSLNFILVCLFFCSCNSRVSKNRVVDEKVVALEPYKQCKSIPEISNEEHSVEYCRMYNRDSSLISEGFYSNGHAIKWHKFYQGGKLISTREYLQELNNDTSILNRIFVFDENGDTNLRESNFYSIIFEKDTFSVIDSIVFKIRYAAPLHINSNSEVAIGIHNSGRIWVSPVDEEYIEFSLPPLNEAGTYFLRGNIRELLAEGDSNTFRDFIINEKYFVGE